MLKTSSWRGLGGDCGGGGGAGLERVHPEFRRGLLFLGEMSHMMSVTPAF